MESSSYNKGQLSVSEFILVSVILVSLLVTSIIFWNLSNTRLKEILDRTNLETAAVSLSDQLVKSPGLPSDWYKNTSRTIALGLANYDRQLNQKKIDALVNMSYDQMRMYLGVSGYQIDIKIYSLESAVKSEIGQKPSNPEIVVNSRRVALLGNETVYMDVTLWR